MLSTKLKKIMNYIDIFIACTNFFTITYVTIDWSAVSLAPEILPFDNLTTLLFNVNKHLK